MSDYRLSPKSACSPMSEAQLACLVREWLEQAFAQVEPIAAIEQIEQQRLALAQQTWRSCCTRRWYGALTTRYSCAPALLLGLLLIGLLVGVALGLGIAGCS